MPIERKMHKPANSHPLGLTKKEQEVLPLIVRGCGNKEISTIMARSPRTVENHVASILKKFKVNNRTKVMLKVSYDPRLMPDTH